MMRISTDNFSGVAGIVAQAAVACCTWLAHWTFARHWGEILEGQRLPPVTTVSLSMLIWLPVFATLILIAGFVVPALRKRLTHWTLAVVILELVALAFVTMGVMLPALTITYSMSS
jgi:hypothetical protein